MRYKLTNIRNYLYAKCREKGCRASLNYRQRDGAFILISARTEHQHRPRQTKSHMYRAVLEYLQAIPKGVSLHSLRHVICQSFHINHRQFYYLLSRLNNNIPTFQEYIEDLEKQEYEIYISR